MHEIRSHGSKKLGLKEHISQYQVASPTSTISPNSWHVRSNEVLTAYNSTGPSPLPPGGCLPISVRPLYLPSPPKCNTRNWICKTHPRYQIPLRDMPRGWYPYPDLTCRFQSLRLWKLYRSGCNLGNITNLGNTHRQNVLQSVIITPTGKYWNPWRCIWNNRNRPSGSYNEE